MENILDRRYFDNMASITDTYVLTGYVSHNCNFLNIFIHCSTVHMEAKEKYVNKILYFSQSDILVFFSWQYLDCAGYYCRYTLSEIDFIYHIQTPKAN